LTGIRQRLQALGGDLTVQLAPTCFVLRWPVGCNLAVGASPAGTPLSKPL
jgi:hypothetical protein